jgi:hypothetical protein
VSARQPACPGRTRRGGSRQLADRHEFPLLATQGSADTINLPGATQTFFSVAPRPKFLLTLTGATHLPPYTTAQPYLGIVERVSIAFLDRYPKDQFSAEHRMLDDGTVRGVATLQSDL